MNISPEKLPSGRVPMEISYHKYKFENWIRQFFISQVCVMQVYLQKKNNKKHANLCLFLNIQIFRAL